MIPINMPQVGQDIPTARIIEWTKKEGEVVRKGDVIALVESDKATFEVPSDGDGMLLKIVVPAGQEGEVLKPIAWLGKPGEQIPADFTSSKAPPAVTVEAEPAAIESASQVVAQPRRFASPSARRVARELGTDWSIAQGSGPGGRVQKKDVLAAAAMVRQITPTAGVAITADQVIPFTRMRQRIAERLTLSKQTIPHFHLCQEVDMTETQEWRRTLNQAENSRVTVTDLIIFTAAKALAEFRRLNAHVESDRLLIRQAVNVGVATALEDGLLTPVIAAADQKSLLEISRISKQNAEAARRGMADSSVSSTFTISSLGQFGIPIFQPIINPPECALLAVGAIQPRVVPVPGGIGVRQMMWLNLACDHRAVDGAYAARFLTRLKELLETNCRTGGEWDRAALQPNTATSSRSVPSSPGES
jgi:pyruvate dehydrogenase E2 component (dihydrolipoamide acetyltransferase)